ncbi:glycosyltransferase [Nitrosococcus wardiae]|uniref:glycosyltransferase n=1 Tax=Nitrosococcus wardiae TaxID=1814290 RepID=UPI001F0FB512|nr:glycosyltransferase [Nitrosococcus wardiae]
MKPRLALFLPDLNGGGAERVMLTLAQGFLERGIQVDLVLAHAVGPLLDLVTQGVSLYSLSDGSRFSSRIGLALSALWGLTRYLRREQPTTLMSTLTGANIIAVLAKILARSPTRLVLREANTALNHRSFLTQFAVRILYPCADAIVAVSQGVQKDLIDRIGISPDKITHIPNPVDIATITRQAEEEINHPWFYKGQSPVIISLGRLTRQKDFTTLIYAFARLRQTRAARLMILGEGEERSKLEALVSRLDLVTDVTLPGFKVNPYPYLQQAALFVLSSRWEGMPSVILEALAFGVPVVATDCHSGPREILEEGRFGNLVPVGHTQALFRAISDALDHATKATVLQTRAEYFSPASTALRYLAVMLPSQAGAKP